MGREEKSAFFGIKNHENMDEARGSSCLKSYF